MLRISARALLAVALGLLGLCFIVPETRATDLARSFQDDEVDCADDLQSLGDIPGTRGLLDAQGKWKTIVRTTEDFLKAVLQGDRHIEVRQHLDFSSFEVSKVFNWTATFHIPETIKTIRGNCASQFPDSIIDGLEGAPVLPQRPGQCLLTFDNIFIAAQSSTGKKLWMDSLYLRDSRGQTNASISDFSPADQENPIIVMLASGRKYDESPNSTARKLYLTNVTLQGNGVDGSRGLYNTGKLFAQDCVFSHLGNVEGLPPVKIRLKKSTANFQDCLFLANFSPNFFGPIMAEDKGAVRLQKCVFSGNEPELLDSFSNGEFFSDDNITVWNDEEGVYGATQTLSEAVQARNWLFGDDNFLTKMRSRYGLPALERIEFEVPPGSPPITAPPPVSDYENEEDIDDYEPLPPTAGPSDPDGGISDNSTDTGSGSTDAVEQGASKGGESAAETPAEAPASSTIPWSAIGGAVAGGLLVLAGVGCFAWGRRARKKKTKKPDDEFPTPVTQIGFGSPTSPLSIIPGPGYIGVTGGGQSPGSGVMSASLHSQDSALPPAMPPNPYHPATITRMGAYGIDHDAATGKTSGSATGANSGGKASGTGMNISGVGLVPSSSGLAPGPHQSAMAVKHTYDTNYDDEFEDMEPPDVYAPVDEKMAFLQYQLDSIGRERSILNGLVLLGGGRFERLQGGQAIVQMARNRLNGLDYAIKFFISSSAFQSEKELYNDETSPLGKFLPQVRDIVNNKDCAVVDPKGNPLPPCIVMERGESLDIWSARARPDRWQAFTVIQHLANRLVNLHTEGYVHRDLKPGNVMWLPRENRWTVIDFGCAAKTGKEAGLGFSIMYAAPEVISSYRGGNKKMKVTEALDAWSLGVLALELLTGESPLNLHEGAASIMDRIEGKNDKKLPWEEEKNQRFYRHKLGIFKNTLLELMDRDPSGRPSMPQFSAACSSILGGSNSVEQS